MRPVLTSADVDDNVVVVRWSDGTTDAVTPRWLRHGCCCPECRTGPNGQFRCDMATLPHDPTVDSVELVELDELAGAGGAASGRHLRVRFGDGHRGLIASDQLAMRRPGSEPRHWNAEHGPLLRLHAVDVSTTNDLADDMARVAEAIVDDGIALLAGVPCLPGEVLNVASQLGFVRTTNYGSVFDVVVEPDPANLANSADGLPLHTDNPYRTPVPTVQLLHCLLAGAGGTSRFVDGFAAAQRLAESDPRAFATLCAVDVPFRYADDDVDLRSRGPLIETDGSGRITGVRVNSRSMQPPDLPVERIDDFYDAYRAFVTELTRPDAVVALSLAPGDLIVFDNRRVLHGRTAFSPQARRHLQGCYVDIDAVASTARRRSQRAAAAVR